MAKSWFAAIEAVTNSRLNHGSSRDNIEQAVLGINESEAQPSSIRHKNSESPEEQRQENNCNIRIQNIIDFCIDGYFRGCTGGTKGSISNPSLQQKNVIAAPAYVAQPLEGGNAGCGGSSAAITSQGSHPAIDSNGSKSWFGRHAARAKVAAWKDQKLKEQPHAHQEPERKHTGSLTRLKRKLDHDEPDADNILANTSKRTCIDNHYKNAESRGYQEACGSEVSEAELGCSGDEVKDVGSDQEDEQQVPSGAQVEKEVQFEASFWEEFGTEGFTAAAAEPEPSPSTSKAKEEDPNKYQCKYCDETFKKKKNLKKHIRRSHSFRPDPETVTATTTTDLFQVSTKRQRKVYECTCCNSKFGTKRGVLDHQNTLKGIRAYRCLHCNASFFTRAAFQTHRNSHCNSDKSRHCCTICNKFFTTARSLKIHDKIVHCGWGIGKFKCQYCVQTFQVRHYLESHVRRIHTKEPIKCDFCCESFLTEYIYRKHRIQVHNGEKAEYKCDLCSAKFYQRNHLAMHKKSHRGEQSSG